MSSGYTYTTYMNWDFWVPVGVSILTILLTAVVVGLSIAWFKFCRSSAHHFLELAYQFGKLVMHDALQRNIRSEPHYLILYDRPISPVFVIILSVLTPVMFIPGFISFWASFLVDETFACDPGLDCFLRNPSSLMIQDQQPLMNCSQLENDTIVCFQFVFDYVAGCASMGGFLIVAVTSLKLYGIILMWLIGIMPSSRDRTGKCYSCRALCSIVGIFIFFLAPVIIASLILATALLDPLVNDIVFQSNERILIFAAYWSCLLLTGLVAGICILATVLGKHLQSGNYGVQDADRNLEAGFDASFKMSATNPLQQSTAKNNLNSSYTAAISSSQPCTGKSNEPDFNPPPLVGSVLSSYRDVTSLPPCHTESSFLLTATASPPDYQTT